MVCSSRRSLGCLRRRATRSVRPGFDPGDKYGQHGPINRFIVNEWSPKSDVLVSVCDANSAWTSFRHPCSQMRPFFLTNSRADIVRIYFHGRESLAVPRDLDVHVRYIPGNPFRHPPVVERHSTRWFIGTDERDRIHQV